VPNDRAIGLSKRNFGCLSRAFLWNGVARFGIESQTLPIILQFYPPSPVLTMYPDAHSTHLDRTVQIRRRAASSSEQLSPSGLGLSFPLPVPPHLRETFTAENDLSRAASPALSTFSSSFQQHNEPSSSYVSDGSDSSGLYLPVPYRSDRPDAYNRLTRDFLTHRTVRSSLFTIYLSDTCPERIFIRIIRILRSSDGTFIRPNESRNREAANRQCQAYVSVFNLAVRNLLSCVLFTYI
jgi:hypothetical protein